MSNNNSKDNNSNKSNIDNSSNANSSNANSSTINTTKESAVSAIKDGMSDNAADTKSAAAPNSSQTSSIQQKEEIPDFTAANHLDTEEGEAARAERDKTLKEEKKAERAKFKTLTFSQKLHYIWDYYKFVGLGIVIIALVVFFTVRAYQRNDYDNVCMVAVFDATISDSYEKNDALTTGFTKYLGIDGTKTRVYFDYSNSFKTAEVTGDGDAIATLNKIYTMASTGYVDAFLADRDYITYLSTDREPLLYDLTELLTSEELEKIKDYIVYYSYKDGSQIPVAVDISECDVIKNTDLSLSDPCYGVIVTASNKDNATAFIRYCFGL